MKNKPVIAVVQDDAVYRLTTQKLLELSGLFSNVLVFENGSSAFLYLQQYNNVEQLPDIILLDIHMPVMDGWAFLEEYEKLSIILSKPSHIFIHTVSLYEKDLRKAEQYKFVVGSIPAPLRITELAQQLQFNIMERKLEA